ncbi:hypothetical protein [Paenibacillus sp. 2TAB19]|uniref:hypothetical protein n=1 Tax=Paenibacillus sp. 2TAB19 TaxID=3233003 RepID=UPI003F9CBCC6
MNEKLRQYRQAEMERWARTRVERGMVIEGKSKVGKLRAGFGMLLSLFGIPK